MAGSCDNVKLLLSSQVDEFYSITGYTNRKVCILFFFRMLHCIDQFFFAKHIDIQVMCSLIKVTIHYLNKVLHALFMCISKCSRIDGLGI